MSYIIPGVPTLGPFLPFLTNIIVLQCIILKTVGPPIPFLITESCKIIWLFSSWKIQNKISLHEKVKTRIHTDIDLYQESRTTGK